MRPAQRFSPGTTVRSDTVSVLPARYSTGMRPTTKTMSATQTTPTGERTPQHEQLDEQIRETYEEYTLKSGRVAMLKDPENEYAWLQSNHAFSVEQMR